MAAKSKLTADHVRYAVVPLLLPTQESVVRRCDSRGSRSCLPAPNRFAFEHLAKLEYIDAALKETLRLKSTAPAFSVTPIQDTEVLAGKYEVEEGQSDHGDP